MIEGIATVAVYVDDQDSALRFWTEQVGFEVARRQSMGPAGDWLELAPKGAASCLVLYPKSIMADWAKHSASIVFECSDIVATHQEMASRGVTFVQEPRDMPWGPFAIFRDPEGNEFMLRQR